MKIFTFQKTGQSYYALPQNNKSQDWDGANIKTVEHGDGWRLPTIDELEVIYEQLHKNGDGCFDNTIYWSATEFNDTVAWYFDFKNGMDGTAIKKLAAKVIIIKEVSQTMVDNENNKIIAFGDIHGCYQAAETAVKLAEELKAKAVFLGDYVDRGPSGIRTLQTLMNAKKKHSDWIFLMGNHEQMLLDLIKGKNKPEDIGTALDGSQFDYAQAEHSYNEWKNLKSDEQHAVVEFIETTKLFYETPHLLFTHAVLRENEQCLQEKSKVELIWNYDYEPKWQGKKFVHGHKNIEKVSFSETSININTFCGYGGHLTGLLFNLETAKPIKLYSISEVGEMLNEESIQTKSIN